MKKLLLIFGFFTISSFCLGQFSASFNTSYGSYKLSDLRIFQEQLRASFPVNAKITSSFPSYWLYDLSLKWYYTSRATFGLNASYGSSGGRIYYSDYSGYTGAEQLISFNAYSFSFGTYRNIQGSNFRIFADIKTGLTFNKLSYNKYTSIVGVGTTQDSYSTIYKSVNWSAEPTLGLVKRIGLFGLNVSASYNLTLINGELPNSGYAIGASTKDIGMDWSGLRFGGGVSIFIKDTIKSPFHAKASFALGVGFDYGGIGANVTFSPVKNVGLFVGAGYALADFGLNGGVKIGTSIDKLNGQPYFMAMYGYNTSIVVSNAPAYNKLFYGPSFGFGIDRPRKSKKKGVVSYGILFPIRGSDATGYIDYLKNNGVVFTTPILPIAGTCGFRF